MKTATLSPQRRTVRRALLVSCIGLFLMFAPMGLGWIDGLEGGFALAMFGLLVMLTGIITAIIFHRLARRYEQIVSDKEPLARWTYTDAQWRAYTEAEHVADTRDRWTLVAIISAFALFFGVLFAVFAPEGGVYVLLTMLGLIGIVSLTAFITSRQNYRRNVLHKGETIIAGDGLILNGQLHAWNVIGSRLERVDYVDATVPLVEFEYSAPSRNGRDSYTVRVPVPSGEEKNARDIVRFFESAVEHEAPDDSEGRI